jgi:hypothetical protein
MDVRVRWSQLERPPSTTLLELMVCLCVIGAMVSVAAHGMRRIEQHFRVLEAVFLAPTAEIAAMEYRAGSGIWPSSNEGVLFPAHPIDKAGGLGESTIRAGAVDYRFSARAKDIAGKVLTFRAWQGSDAGAPAAWLCGHARAMSTTAAADDRTTLDDGELASPCTARH